MTERQGTLTGRFRRLLDRQTVVLPGAFNALTAIQIERAGFEALYISGAGLSAARGVPDLGLLSMAEVVSDAATIARSVTIPALMDADTGFGSALNVMRTVEQCEAAGLVGMQLEDQELPKRCGHLPGKVLVPMSEMAGKVRAACLARKDPDFLIIARTDARAIEGMEGSLTRALAYVEAGADALFPEALESAEEFRLFAVRLAKEGVKVPLVANMTEFGKTPYLSVEEFEALGYRLVLFPVSTLRIAAKAVEEFLHDLKRFGSQKDRLPRMQTRRELYDLLRYEDYERQSHLCEEPHDDTSN
jgi:methylisocitrate lyase